MNLFHSLLPLPHNNDETINELVADREDFFSHANVLKPRERRKKQKISAVIFSVCFLMSTFDIRTH